MSLTIRGAWRPKQWTQGCYISGPMSGYKSLNLAWFNHLAKGLTDKGWYVLNPASFKNYRWWICMTRDLSLLAWDCIRGKLGAIVVHPQWRWSAGARLEVLLGLVFGLCILTPDEAEKIVPNHGIPIRHTDEE